MLQLLFQGQAIHFEYFLFLTFDAFSDFIYSHLFVEIIAANPLAMFTCLNIKFKWRVMFLARVAGIGCIW